MDPKIEIISPSEIRVDGVNYGAAIDCIPNNPKLAPGIQRALVAWHQGVLDTQAQATRDAQDGAAASIATAKADFETQLADKTAELEKAASNSIDAKSQELTTQRTVELQAALDAKTQEVSALIQQLAQVTATKDVLAARVAAQPVAEVIEVIQP
jgi:dGTP triphosphohydrolase